MMAYRSTMIYRPKGNLSVEKMSLSAPSYRQLLVLFRRLGLAIPPVL